jgi:hypothetical protein
MEFEPLGNIRRFVSNDGEDGEIVRKARGKATRAGGMGSNKKANR